MAAVVRSNAAVAQAPIQRKRRKSPDGIATNDLTVSAYHGVNADVFPHILALYVPKGSRVADVTYGRGAFWKHVNAKRY